MTRSIFPLRSESTVPMAQEAAGQLARALAWLDKKFVSSLHSLALAFFNSLWYGIKFGSLSRASGQPDTLLFYKAVRYFKTDRTSELFLGKLLVYKSRTVVFCRRTA